MLESYEFLNINAFERKYEDFVDAIKVIVYPYYFY